MSDHPPSFRRQHWLLEISLDRPVLVMLALYLLVWIIKILDTFIFRLDELIGEAILTKALGFVVVVAYVWTAGRRLRDIGFHRRHLSATLATAVVGLQPGLRHRIHCAARDPQSVRRRGAYRLLCR